MAYAAYWSSINRNSSSQKQDVPQTSRFQSQQVTPTTSPQVSTVKPAQYEKGQSQSSTAGSAGGEGPKTTQKAPSQVTPQASVSKPTLVSSGTGAAGTTGGTGVKPTDPAKDKAQSTTVPSSKPGPAKVDPAVGKPSTTTGTQKQTSAQKVQVEVSRPGAKVSKEDVDPFDALSGTLAPSQPVTPKVPAFTGPEVIEPSIKQEKGVFCGERDDTLPPGYRKEDLEKKKPSGVPEKPKEVAKPISTDEALESLSAGFVSSAPAAPKKTDVKTETVGAVHAQTNFAPPPPSQQKQQPTPQTATGNKSTAPPADKKAKIEIPPQPAKPKTDESDPMSLDALAALSDTLGAPEPPKKTPELKPGQIVYEKQQTSEKGVRVGEREDTLPPNYRFSEEDLKKYPPPQKEASLNTDDALDILSEGFTTSAAAPVVKASVPPTKETKKPVGELVTPAKSASKVSSAAPKIIPPGPPQKPETPEDALAALSDTLGAPEPPKKTPELKPGQIVYEKQQTSEKGVRVGEREDTLPPNYRFSEEDLKKYPPPQKEASLNTDDALDILSEGFTTSAAAPVVKASVPPTKVSSAAPKIIPPGPPQKPETPEDALAALGDTLGAPEPPKKTPQLKPEDIVYEEDVISEKGVRVGERDDTLPPDYRFSEKDLKKYPPPPKEPSLDTTEALDILSGDFTTPSAPSAAKSPSSKSPAKSSGSASDLALDALGDDFLASSSASTVRSAISGPPHTDRQMSEGTSSALDALSDTLAGIKAAPEPAPVSPKAIVKEKNIVEERVSKPGERDDTLPPDHRFTEEDRKAFEAAKPKDVKPKQPLIDDATALDMLSSDFSSVPLVKPTVQDVKSFTPEPTPSTFKASGSVLDELAEKMIPNLTDPKAKDSKAKGKGAKPKFKPKKQTVEDSSDPLQLPGKPRSDVVPSSSTKAGNR